MIPLQDNAWDAWSPSELFARLGQCGANWYVAGGWALDLWHGRQTRVHEDLEFVVLPERVSHFRKALSELEFFAARAGTLTHLAATDPLPDDLWQIWGADMTRLRWRVDMMVERGTPDRWRYKRHPSLSLPRADAIRRTTEGIAYLAPAIVLLFKAKLCRDKDELDFRAALPKLDPREKADLHNWLSRLHPGHPWIMLLKPNAIASN